MLRKLHILLVAAVAASFAVALGTSPAQAAFPGQNGNIVFAAPIDGDYDIHFIQPNGGLGKLTHNKAFDTEPAYSADRDLAWASNSGPGGDLDIYRRDAGENDVWPLTTNPAQDTEPTWSPDGKRIAFSSNRDGNWNIYVMDRDGKNAKPVTSGPGDEFHPAWAPQGDRIAYVSNADGDDEIYVDDLHPATRASKLTDNTFSDRRPSWSPSGERIVFTSDRYQANYNIYYMASTGDGQARLTDDLAFDSQPVYSPQGDRIAFVSERLGAPRLFTMDVSGNDEALLTGSPATAETPDWGRQAEVKQSVYAIKVDEHGTYATVSFKQARPTTKARVELWLPKKQAGAQVRTQTKSAGAEQTAWSITVTHLDPATKYELHIVTPDANGVDYEYVQAAVVKTLTRNVHVGITKIKLIDDSDPNGCGELSFDFLLAGQLARFGDEDFCDHQVRDVDIPLDAKNVKEDSLDLKMLAVDNDECECGFGPGFTTLSYGSLKDDGEWTEGTGKLPVAAKSFSTQGENYTILVKIKVNGPSGRPSFRVSLLLTVRHV